MVFIEFSLYFIILFFSPTLSVWISGGCAPASCNLHGYCYNKIPILGTNETISHECSCFSSYSGINCETVALQIVSVGPFNGAFIQPQVAYPHEWKYYYFGSTMQRPFPFNGAEINIMMKSWADPKDTKTEPCTFIVSTSGTVWLESPMKDDLEEYDVIVGNGSSIVSGEALDLIVFVSVTRNISQENSKHYCLFQIEALANCEGLCSHGECKQGYGVCVCDSGWTGRRCDEKKEIFTTLYIVILVVGSCLFGVSITTILCWFIERRRSRAREFRYTALTPRFNNLQKK